MDNLAWSAMSLNGCLEYLIGDIRRLKPCACLFIFLLSSQMLTQALAQQTNTGGGDGMVQEMDKSNVSNVVPEPNDPVLTPYWSPLVFSVNETAVVDCGVYTGGHPDSVTMKWIKQGGKQLDEPRVKSVRRDTFTDDTTIFGAYSVLTLTLTHLDMSDSGVYTCTVTTKADDSTKSINFTLNVVDPLSHCGFEDSMCGWITSPEWHVHTSSDADIIARAKQGALFDHTYGSSKHIGHFLDMDPKHLPQANRNTTARLTSPIIAKHNEYKCLQFWYIFEGRERGSLRVSLHNVSDPERIMSDVWSISEDVGPEWQIATVRLPPNTQDYHIIIEADMCVDNCRKAATSLDDLSLTTPENGVCSHNKPNKNLRVRLIGGSTNKEGRVEVLHDGQWGSVCSREFGLNEARVICQTLGFSDGVENAQKCRNAHFGQSPPGSVIWLQRLACPNNKDRKLESCLKPGETWGKSECQHKEDAGVICSDKPVECTTSIVLPPATTRKVTTPTTPKLTTTTTTPTTTTTTTMKSTTKSIISTTPTKPKNSNTSVATQSKASTVAVQTTAPSTASTVLREMSPAPNITQHPATEIKNNGSTPGKPTTIPGVTPTPLKPASKPTVTASAAPPSSTKKITATTMKVTPSSKTTPMATTPKANHSTSKFVLPDTVKTPSHESDNTKSQSTKPSTTTESILADISSLPSSAGNNAGVAIGIILGLLIAATALGIVLYRRKRKGKKSTYITFGNPSYSREHLPANDFSLESPLTLSSNGYTVLA